MEKVVAVTGAGLIIPAVMDFTEIGTVAGNAGAVNKKVENVTAVPGYSGRVPDFLPLPQQGDNSEVKKGFSVSEGSAFLLLEHPECVRALKKKPIAFFEPLSNLPADRAHPDLIISGAGAGPHDIHELRLLKKIVFRQPGPISIIFSKPFFGECFALGSLLSSVMACDYLNNRTDYRGIPLHRDLTGKTLSETGRDNCRSILVTAAGKTTIISIMCGILNITAGVVRVNDIDVRQNSDKIRKLIGLIPQDLALYPSLTIRENLLYFGRMHGMRGKILRERVDECVDIAGLSMHTGKRVVNS